MLIFWTKIVNLKNIIKESQEVKTMIQYRCFLFGGPTGQVLQYSEKATLHWASAYEFVLSLLGFIAPPLYVHKAHCKYLPSGPKLKHNSHTQSSVGILGIP